MNKKLIIITVLIISAVLIWYFAFPKNPETAFMSAEKNTKITVSVATLALEKIQTKIELPGRIIAYTKAEVRPQVNGIITQRLFKEGAYVEKGDQLYQIDDAKYKAELNSAVADLNSAKANSKSIGAKAARYANLVKANAVSKQEYDDITAQLDQAKAAVAVAQAAVDLAKVNLDYTKVYAPISGKIGRTLVSEGTLVTSNQSESLAVITQLDNVYVDMQKSGDSITEIQMYLIQNAMIPVSLSIGNTDAIPYSQKGELQFSEVNIDESTGSVTLRALMPNPDSLLLPGMFVRATLELGEQETLLVPQRATLRQPEGDLSVWVIDSTNKASKKIIKAQRAHGDAWVVESGLNAGDIIAITGHQKLSEGAEVSTVPWDDTTATQIESDEIKSKE